jgi:hypothetical protein
MHIVERDKLCRLALFDVLACYVELGFRRLEDR